MHTDIDLALSQRTQENCSGCSSSLPSLHLQDLGEDVDVDPEALLLASEWDFLPHRASLGLACAQAWHKATTLYMISTLMLSANFA